MIINKQTHFVLSDFNKTHTFSIRYFADHVRRWRRHIDFSKYPKIDFDKDVECKKVGGSGPGGQAVNKARSAVQLRHVNTGVVVKCHETRCGDKNEKIAQTRLTDAVDLHLNGEGSVKSQASLLHLQWKVDMKAEKKRLRELKQHKMLHDDEEADGARADNHFIDVSTDIITPTTCTINVIESTNINFEDINGEIITNVKKSKKGT